MGDGEVRSDGVVLRPGSGPAYLSGELASYLRNNLQILLLSRLEN